MDSLRNAISFRERAAALIIVLAFVVLLTGLVVAYLSRATSDRQVAQSSYNQSNADRIAASAMDLIIGSLRQEITGPSPTPTPTHVYLPATAANMLPMRFRTSDSMPNLVRRSAQGDGPAGAVNAIPPPGIPSWASAVNSAPTDPNNVKRGEITRARWNKHYLVPRPAGAGPTDTTPITGVNGFTAPDWVIVTRTSRNPADPLSPYPVAFSGWEAALKDPTPKPSPQPDLYAVGRYAYAIYDEGGLLDANVAGYPSNTTSAQYGPKGISAFADLTVLGLSQAPSIDAIVGWRNYFSANPGGTFPGFTFDSTAATNYVNSVVSNTTGFMTVPIPSPTPSTVTDQQFPTRNSLIQLLVNTSAFSVATRTANANALQYLGTFSREVATPQWSPVAPDSINPNFQTLLVTAPFTRNDGTTANIGDPLVNKRFLLQRLNWLTYKGPSALTVNGGTRNAVPTKAPKTTTDPDWDLWLLTSRFGLTTAFLQDPAVGGTPTNILKYFGLSWDTTNERWNYVGHGGSTSPISSIATFGVGGTQTATREPDFFELLQAGILNSSLGDAAAADPVLPILHQQSKMLHILTIGANLIAQSRADSYPVRIACSVGGTTMEAVGAARLPYLSGLAACPVAGTGWQGGINWLLVPNLWDPFRDSWDLTEQNASATLTPNYLRPPVRITVSGSVGFGTIVNSASVKSGSVPSASVTSFPAVLAVPSQSLALTTSTPTPTPGRDGFLEASRMGTSDTSPTPTPFVTTTSVSPTPSAQWNNIPYPNPTPSPTPVGGNVVFRISLPGSSIPTSTLSPTQNPVLILKPAFQMTVDYQSPNGTWYSYSFLQGNSATNTWISGSNAANPSLNLTTVLSKYGQNLAPSPTPPPSPSPTPTPRPTVLLSSTGVATPWNVTTLAPAPMFAKADPRSIRYDSQIGVITLTSPPTSTPSAAGVIGSIWPSGYTTPPPMTIASTPTPTPTPIPTPTPSVTPTPTPTPSPNPTATPNPPNPATLGDNALAGNTANPYNESSGAGWRPVMMNRPFRSVGEMAYAFRDQPFKTLDFSSANSPDAGLLDLFCVNSYDRTLATPTPSPTPTATPLPRGGVISLNSRQTPALAAMLANAFTQENIPRSTPTPAPSPWLLASGNATSIATSLVSQTSTTPLTNRVGLPAFIANQPTLGSTVPKTQRESIARSLGEAGQTRTWNLLIDVVAQSGHYKPNATDLRNDFLVEGEQHYWVHVAIDRFTGQVIDRQIEVVNE